MPLLTRYEGGSVHHVLPTGGERRRDGRLTPLGYTEAPLCGAVPSAIEHEVRGGDVSDEDIGSKAIKICSRCVAVSNRLSSANEV